MLRLAVLVGLIVVHDVSPFPQELFPEPPGQNQKTNVSPEISKYTNETLNLYYQDDIQALFNNSVDFKVTEGSPLPDAYNHTVPNRNLTDIEMLRFLIFSFGDAFRVVWTRLAKETDLNITSLRLYNEKGYRPLTRYHIFRRKRHAAGCHGEGSKDKSGRQRRHGGCQKEVKQGSEGSENSTNIDDGKMVELNFEPVNNETMTSVPVARFLRKRGAETTTATVPPNDATISSEIRSRRQVITAELPAPVLNETQATTLPPEIRNRREVIATEMPAPVLNETQATTLPPEIRNRREVIATEIPAPVLSETQATTLPPEIRNRREAIATKLPSPVMYETQASASGELPFTTKLPVFRKRMSSESKPSEPLPIPEPSPEPTAAIANESDTEVPILAVIASTLVTSDPHPKIKRAAENSSITTVSPGESTMPTLSSGEMTEMMEASATEETLSVESSTQKFDITSIKDNGEEDEKENKEKNEKRDENKETEDKEQKDKDEDKKKDSKVKDEDKKEDAKDKEN